MNPAEDRNLLELMPKMVKAMFTITGAIIISSAITFLANHPCLDCVMVYWIPGTNILAAWIYPTSVIIIGFFCILYGMKFGLRGLGLLVMVFGAFDVFAKIFALYFQGLITGQFGCGPNTVCAGSDEYFWIQNALMIGGFLIAGIPKLKVTTYLWLTLGILGWSELTWWPYLVQWHGIFAYQFYEVALFLYVYKSTELRPMSWFREAARL